MDTSYRHQEDNKRRKHSLRRQPRLIFLYYSWHELLPPDHGIANAIDLEFKSKTKPYVQCIANALHITEGIDMLHEKSFIEILSNPFVLLASGQVRRMVAHWEVSTTTCEQGHVHTRTPLPRIEGTLDMLGEAQLQYIAALELHSRYQIRSDPHQILMVCGEDGFCTFVWTT